MVWYAPLRFSGVHDIEQACEAGDGLYNEEKVLCVKRQYRCLLFVRACMTLHKEIKNFQLFLHRFTDVVRNQSRIHVVPFECRQRRMIR